MPSGFAYPAPSISLHKSNNARRILECVTPSNVFYSIGILTDSPSTTPFGLALGPTNPGTIAVARETLDFRCAWISHALRLLMPTFSLPCAPRHLAMHASAHKERSPTDRELHWGSKFQRSKLKFASRGCLFNNSILCCFLFYYFLHVAVRIFRRIKKNFH